MPIVGTVDLSSILGNLGDPEHGLKAAGPAQNTEKQVEDHIYQATWGPVDMSTGTGLERAWKQIWDVNGYYRALGIPWPFTAGKKALRLAYQQRDGHQDEYLTYVMKQLLTPKVRASYDSMPLGSTFKDKYVIQGHIRRLSKVAAKVSDQERRVVTIEELIDEEDEIRAGRGKLPELNPLNSTWEWGYYLLQSRKSEYGELIRWQEYLTHAFAARGLVKVISIGYIGSTPKPFVIKKWQGKTIFFLNDEETPSLELAETAVSLIAPSTEGTE
jgi:hypothetical protein